MPKYVCSACNKIQIRNAGQLRRINPAHKSYCESTGKMGILTRLRIKPKKVNNGNH